MVVLAARNAKQPANPYGYRLLDETQTLSDGRVPSVIEYFTDAGLAANT